MRLARVGHESVKGFLKGGMSAWGSSGLEVATVPQVSVNELRGMIEGHAGLQLIDVRRTVEYTGGHAPRAVNAPLSQLENSLKDFDSARETAVICAGGYRSSAATSILARHGFQKLYNVTGGTSAWVSAGLPVEKVSTN